jgi:hypothetical protein
MIGPTAETGNRHVGKLRFFWGEEEGVRLLLDTRPRCLRKCWQVRGRGGGCCGVGMKNQPDVDKIWQRMESGAC